MCGAEDIEDRLGGMPGRMWGMGAMKMYRDKYIYDKRGKT